MDNLQTASAYVNNLLLARGLLRAGKPVDLAHLSACTCKSNKSAADAKPSKDQPTPTGPAEVINLVHDLVLRRDRDQEQLESLAFTLRSLRSEASRNTTEVERLREKNTELNRQLALHTSTTRTAQAAASAAEASARSLREEATRSKTLLNQVKTQCANDIRKRDVQIQKLKTHLAVRQRGTGKAPLGGGLVIQPGVTGMAHTHDIGADEREEAPSLEQATYSLKQETTEFLTALSASLSEENDCLIGLLRETISNLKDLQGLHPSAASASQSHEQLVTTPPTFISLQADLQLVLSHLTELLTNPSFAPIEEVHSRDEEIARLREGWETMAARWQEAVQMMAGWRKRMLRGGGTVNLEELRAGLCLGDGLGSPDGKAVKPPLAPLEDDEEVEQSDAEEPEQDVANLPPVEDDDEDFIVDEPALLASKTSTDEPTHDQEDDHDCSFTPSNEPPLRDASGNKGQQPSSRHPSIPTNAHTTNDQENDAPDSSPLPAKPVARGYLRSTASSKLNASQSRKQPQPSPRASKSSTAPHHPSLTVAQKLELAEREARRASGCSSPLDLVGAKTSAQDSVEERRQPQQSRVGSLRDARGGAKTSKGKVEVGEGGSPVKRTRITGRPRRRKSTLSPDELDALMRQL